MNMFTGFHIASVDVGVFFSPPVLFKVNYSFQEKISFNMIKIGVACRGGFMIVIRLLFIMHHMSCKLCIEIFKFCLKCT